MNDLNFLDHNLYFSNINHEELHSRPFDLSNDEQTTENGIIRYN